jgi:UDPglucose 6-dehydrogenase
MTISIIGTGYVGLTLASLTSKVGYKTYCIDVIPKKIETIKKSKSYFYELGLDDLVKQGIDSGNLVPTLDYKEGLNDADIVFLCVGTPSDGNGRFDLSYLLSAIKEAVKCVKDGVIFVQRSTVAVGTGKTVMKMIDEINPDLEYTYLSSPEFLREGSAVIDSIRPDRIVVGGDNEKAKEKVFKIFKEIDGIASQIIKESPEISKYAMNNISNGNGKDLKFKDKCISTKLESAELIKVTANSFLATKISFANNIARLCDKVDANVNEVMDGVGMDRRISRSFLYAGIGFGGGCFPKDVKGLINSLDEHNVDSQFFNEVLDVNSSQVDYVIDCIKEMGIKSGKVGVLGLAFKQGTSDVRESPACRLCEALVEDGYEVIGTDPQAIEEAKKMFPERDNPKYTEDIEDVFKDSSIVVLATDWPEFKELDYVKLSEMMKNKNFYDARNYLDRNKMESIFNFDNLGS